MKCFAYAVESGNTGLRLFGDQQDSFWAGTLISFANLDRRYATFHRELLELAGKSELHGNELGFGRIERIAGRLAWFIREKKIQFSFFRIFKPYLATSKMFDLAFDSGVNPAVPPQAYAVRQLRLINLLHFAQLPVGATGFIAAELWAEMTGQIDTFYPHATAAFRQDFQQLGDTSISPNDLRATVQRLIDFLQEA